MFEENNSDLQKQLFQQLFANAVDDEVSEINTNTRNESNTEIAMNNDLKVSIYAVNGTNSNFVEISLAGYTKEDLTLQYIKIDDESDQDRIELVVDVYHNTQYREYLQGEPLKSFKTHLSVLEGSKVSDVEFENGLLTFEIIPPSPDSYKIDIS